MLSAFQLENNRLTRLEAEESQPLIDAVWVDLVEPDDDERLRVQSELGQSRQPARNWKTSKPPRVSLKMKTACTFTSSSLKMRKITRATPPWRLPFATVVCLLCVNANCRHSVSTACVPAAAMVDGNAYELLLDLFETKIEQLADEIENIYSDLEKLSRVIMEGHQGMSTTKRFRRWQSWKISAGRCVCV